MFFFFVLQISSMKRKRRKSCGNNILLWRDNLLFWIFVSILYYTFVCVFVALISLWSIFQYFSILLIKFIFCSVPHNDIYLLINMQNYWNNIQILSGPCATTTMIFPRKIELGVGYFLARVRGRVYLPPIKLSKVLDRAPSQHHSTC